MKSTKIIFFLAILGLLIPSTFVLAVEDFNPNFIISDSELQNYSSMNRADIQAFLLANGKFLSTYKSPDKNGVNRTASDIIYRSAQDNKINPKYLLVKLQKEQSLISTTNPTQKQLNWATGYGICDNCSMSDPTLQKHIGFGTQVDSAAGIMRWYYDNQYSESWIKKASVAYNIDGQTIVPASSATAFLYTYTPHILGNKNFWKLWNTWFEQRYPDGTLLQDAETKLIYLLQDGEKRLISSMSVLISRFDPKFIITAPASELSRYEDGKPLNLPNFSVVKNGVKYYLLDYDHKRPFANYETVKQLGYHPDEIVNVTTADLDAYSIGETITANQENPLGRLLKIEELGKYYFFKSGVYMPVTDPQIAKTNFSEFSIETVNLADLGELVLGNAILFKNGTLFGITGSNKIYVVENGKKRHIADEDVFNGLGFNWKNIIWTDQFTGMSHITGEAIYLRGEIQPVNQTTQVVAQEPTIEEIPSNIEDLMEKTPETETAFVGDVFETTIDAYLVTEYETEKILAGKNINVIRPMASFTKVMTAFRLLQEGLTLSNIGTVTYKSSEHKSTMHYFRVSEGETFRNKDIMNALLVSSLNTPAKMLVSEVEKYEPSFISRMNKQATEWELSNTSFTDTYGYDLGNKSTVLDYTKLFKKVIANGSLQKIMGLASYEYDEIIDKDGREHHYDYNTNELLEYTDLPYNIISSKTGFLYEAGSNLAMLIERKSDGKKFVITTMGNPDYQNRFVEPNKLSKWVINNF
ncbi:MAG: serine hydrolase [Candidatus Magasanikbacteria bacterium]|nr:serine hydrolase [Candidatus Magasanikbacteria bacterium]